MSNGKEPETTASDGSWIGELIVAAIVLYFARMAAPMLNYYENLGVGTTMWNNADGILESGFAFFIMWGSLALQFITVGVPAMTYLMRNEPTVSTVGVGFVALGPLGWYIGSSFAEAYARKAACTSQSFFGIGCTLDGEPIMTFFLFSIIVVCIAMMVVMMFVGAALTKLSS